MSFFSNLDESIGSSTLDLVVWHISDVFTVPRLVGSQMGKAGGKEYGITGVMEAKAATKQSSGEENAALERGMESRRLLKRGSGHQC